MVKSSALSLPKIGEALLYATQANSKTLPCERNFANLVAASPWVLTARHHRTRHVLDVMQARPGCILADLGAGIGLNSVLAVLCGAGEVYTIEREPKRHRTAELMIEALGLQNRIHLCKADLLDFDLPAGCLDGAYSSELLEHIADLPSLYRRARIWLRPGGGIYARTGANGRSWLKRRFFFPKAWDIADQDFKPQRAALIRAKAPQLDAEQVAVMVERTCGMLAPSVEEAVDTFLRTGDYPQDRRPIVARNPHSGEYEERDLDAFKTAREIDQEGFRTRVIRPDMTSLTMIHPFKRRVFWLVGQMVRITHPVSLCVAPWLEFLSVKVDDAEARLAC